MKKNIYVTMLISLCVFCTYISAAQIKGNYAIKNKETGMLLRPESANKKAGAPIVLYSPTNWKCLTWDFIHVEGNTYLLKNLFTKKTFQPQEMSNGSTLVQQPINKDSKLQFWEFVESGSNQYYIRLKSTEFYLTPSKKGANSTVVIKNRSGDNQIWTIYMQSPDI